MLISDLYVQELRNVMRIRSTGRVVSLFTRRWDDAAADANDAAGDSPPCAPPGAYSDFRQNSDR